MKTMNRTIFAAALALSVTGAFVLGTPAYAQSSAVQLSSDVIVEKVETATDGTQKTVSKAPKDTLVVPGDKLIVTLSYTNTGAEPAANFIATNPLPSAVQFASVGEDWADVSVDGGKSFGKLAALTVNVPATETAPAATRAATPEDVTTIRWAFKQPIPAGAKGSVSYRGVIK